MSEQLAIFEIIALFITPPITVFVGGLVRKYFNNETESELNQRFHRFWDGRCENELYAWQMVRKYVMQTSANPEKLKWIDQKISSLNKNKITSKSLTVDESGGLVKR